MRFRYRVTTVTIERFGDNQRPKTLCKYHSQVTLLGTKWLTKDGQVVIFDETRVEGDRLIAVFAAGQWVCVETLGPEEVES